MKEKSALEIWLKGKSSDLTPNNVWEILDNLYNKKIAEIFFIGMGWPEGYHYCADKEYVLKTFAPMALEKHLRAIWFACNFLQDYRK